MFSSQHNDNTESGSDKSQDGLFDGDERQFAAIRELAQQYRERAEQAERRAQWAEAYLGRIEQIAGAPMPLGYKTGEKFRTICLTLLDYEHRQPGDRNPLELPMTLADMVSRFGESRRTWDNYLEQANQAKLAHHPVQKICYERSTGREVNPADVDLSNKRRYGWMSRSSVVIAPLGEVLPALPVTDYDTGKQEDAELSRAEKEQLKAENSELHNLIASLDEQLAGAVCPECGLRNCMHVARIVCTNTGAVIYTLAEVPQTVQPEPEPGDSGKVLSSSSVVEKFRIAPQDALSREHTTAPEPEPATEAKPETCTTSGADTVAMLGSLSATFCKVYKPGQRMKNGRIATGKEPIGDAWNTAEKAFDEPAAIEHVLAGGNVGLLCGASSGGLYLPDIDAGVQAWEQAHPEWAHYPKFVRDNATDRAKYLVRLPPGEVLSKTRDAFTNEAGTFKGEILGSGVSHGVVVAAHGVVAGVHETGAEIRYINAVCDIADVPVVSLAELRSRIAALGGKFAAEAKPKQPKAHAARVCFSASSGARRRDGSLVEASIAHYNATHKAEDVIAASTRRKGDFIAVRDADSKPSVHPDYDDFEREMYTDFGNGEKLDAFELYVRTNRLDKRATIWKELVPAYLEFQRTGKAV